MEDPQMITQLTILIVVHDSYFQLLSENFLFSIFS